MASLNFPSLPAVNQSHSQAGRTWKWNGEAWDLQSTIDASTIVNSVCGATGHVYPVCSLNGFTGTVSITGGNQITVSNSGNVITIDTIEGAQSDLDADLLGGISYKRFHEDLKTGILYGGILSINGASAAQFDISGGKGIIVDPGGSTFGWPNPTVTEVSWSNTTGITLANTTQDFTWVLINSSGDIVQQTSLAPFDPVSNIFIGALSHPTPSFIASAMTTPVPTYNSEAQSEIFMRSFGGLKLSGNDISANGANLKLNRSSGRSFALGRNYTVEPDQSCVVDDVAYNDPVLFFSYRGATTGTFQSTLFQTAIDPTKYDDGSGTLQTVSPNKWTIQKVFFFPHDPSALVVYYGRAIYNNISEAQSNMLTESFSEHELTRTQSVFCAYIIVRGGATDLSNISDAKIIQAGLFRSSSGGGGGTVSLSFDDITDVTITSPATNELVYYSGTEWVNTAISNLPLVSSFNGSTGAVQGVSAAVAGTGISVSGATGSVTISNLGVLSVSGTSPIAAATDENMAVSVTHTTSGVVAATYGSATVVPIVTVNNTGHITSAVNTTIAITSSAVSDFNEAAQDTTASMITGGTHTAISASYDDGAGTLSLTNTGVTSLNGLTGAMTYSLHRGLFTNTGRYHYPIGCSSTGNGASNVSANNLVLMPFHFPVQAKIDSLGYRTTNDANSSSMQYKYGLYTHNYTTGRPETLITTLATGTDPGTTNTDVRNTIDYTISPGTYWIGIIFDMTASTIYWNGRDATYMNGFFNTTGTSGKGLYYAVGSFTLDSDLTTKTLLYDTSARTTNIALIMETP